MIRRHPSTVDAHPVGYRLRRHAPGVRTAGSSTRAPARSSTSTAAACSAPAARERMIRRHPAAVDAHPVGYGLLGHTSSARSSARSALTCARHARIAPREPYAAGEHAAAAREKWIRRRRATTRRAPAGADDASKLSRAPVEEEHLAVCVEPERADVADDGGAAELCRVLDDLSGLCFLRRGVDRQPDRPDSPRTEISEEIAAPESDSERRAAIHDPSGDHEAHRVRGTRRLDRRAAGTQADGR